jgi:hypothetical protein
MTNLMHKFLILYICLFTSALRVLGFPLAHLQRQLYNFPLAHLQRQLYNFGSGSSPLGVMSVRVHTFNRRYLLKCVHFFWADSVFVVHIC